jgi:hypothetical protein
MQILKVFISWSGDRSRLVGELLDQWLQCVLQAVNPWMSSKDIDRGSLWFSEITDQLKDTTIGIICLTKSNKDKPWILFEAGALAKGLSSSRVCTLLIDLVPTDIQDPLAQFNHTLPVKDGIWQLTRTLNSALLDKGLKEKILEQVFETYWPQFIEQFDGIIAKTDGLSAEPEKRPNEEILIELLSATRNIDKRIRYIENQNRHDIRSDIRGDNRNEFRNDIVPRLYTKKEQIALRDEIERRIVNYSNTGIELDKIFEMFKEVLSPEQIKSIIEQNININ